MNVRINTALNPGDVVGIYTDYKEEIEYEGEAILLEKLKDGDSFYLFHEDIRPPDKKEYSEEDLSLIRRYNRLVNLFKGTKSKLKVELVCKKLYKELLEQRKDELDDHLRMGNILDKYRKKYGSSIYKIGTLLKEYNNYYIIRFIQQDRKSWRQSIFNYERWHIKFIKDKTGWPIEWTTHRNIRVLKCYNPSETMRNSGLRKFTTYENGIPSKHYDRIHDINEYNRKKKKENEKNEAIFLDDEEMESVILTKLNNLNNEKKD